MVWDCIKKKLKKSKPRNIQELTTFVKKIWDEEVTIEAINNLVLSFRLRLELVLLHSGKSISDQLRKGISISSNFPIPERPEAEEIIHECISEMERDDNPMNLQHLRKQDFQQNQIRRIIIRNFI
jgi:hypothetical protein